MKDIVIKQYGKWMAADIQTPISLFLRLVGTKQGILLESAEVDGRLGRYSVIAWDFRLKLSCADGKLEVCALDEELKPLTSAAGKDYLTGLREVMGRLKVEPEEGFGSLPPITRGLVGYFGYGMAGLFEPKLASVIPPETAESVLVLPGKVVLFDHLHQRCCFLSTDKNCKPDLGDLRQALDMVQPDFGAAKSTPGREDYMAGVDQARELIRQGEAIQIVLSTKFEAPFSGEPFVVYRRLRQVNPSPYMFFMRLPRVTLFGSSPELMVRCQKGELEVRPIAGTRRRGASETEDIRLAEELLADPKERAEHVMLVDLGRNDLGRIAEPGSVAVDRFMQVERFSHVMHLTSYVRARLAEGLDAIDVLASTFPAGTLSGAPKIRAMEIIADIEKTARGPYAGCIGWIGLDEGRVDVDTGITIRSMWVRDGMATWQAGAGIVFDSDPAAEWTECQNKAKVLAVVMAGKEESDVFAY